MSTQFQFSGIFNGLDEAEAKSLFRKLSFQHHPDTGGSDEAFRALVAEFEKARAPFQTTDKTESASFADMIYDLLKMRGLEFDIVGAWIWVVSNDASFQNKETLKEMGFRWSGPHKRWYWAGNTRKGASSRKSFGEIVQRYGRQSFVAGSIE